MEYLIRLQRAIDHVETHAEENLSLEELARIACYSRSQFIWLFECATVFYENSCSMIDVMK